MADKEKDKPQEKGMFASFKDKVMGTPEQNAKAAAEMKEQDKKNPDSVQAKINKITNYGGYKKGGKVSSASSRADGCCIKGKTRGRMM